MVWLIFTGNDLDDPYYPELENPKPSRPPLLSRLASGLHDFRLRSPVRRFLSRIEGKPGDVVIEKKLADGRQVLFNKTYAERRGRTAEDILRHPNLVNLKTTLGAMERLAAERHFAVAVVLVPSKEEVYSWVLDEAQPWSSPARSSGFSSVLQGLCAQHRFRFLDLKPALIEASSREYKQSGALLWWRDDSHWNGAGQRITAAVIYETLFHASPTP